MNINNLLDFSFSTTVYKENGVKLFSSKMQQHFEGNILNLKEINERINTTVESPSIANLIPEIFKRFKLGVTSNVAPNFDRRELRSLAYALNYSEHKQSSIFSQPTEIELALRILDANWMDSYLFGILDCYLNNWNSANQKSFVQLKEFGFYKLKNYTGNRIALIIMLPQNWTGS